MSGPWYDTGEGVLLVGEAAFEQRAAQDPTTVIALGKLLLDREFDAQQYSHVEHLDTTGWTADDAAAHGAWLQSVLVDEDPTATLRREHIRRAYILGVGPDERPMLRMIGANTLSDLRQKIGATEGYSRGRFDNWTLEDFFYYARQVERDIGRKPTEPDYANYADEYPDSPSVHIIKRRIGVSSLNELIGYPNVKTWDANDYLDWGVEVMKANNGLIVSPRVVTALAHRKRGPSVPTIERRFDSWASYKKQVLQHYQQWQLEKQSRLNGYENWIDKGKLPTHMREYSEEALLRAGGITTLIRAFVPRPNESRLAHLVDRHIAYTLRYIQSKNPNTTVDDIERAAAEHGIFDDVWPMKSDMQAYLRVLKLADFRGLGQRLQYAESNQVVLRASLQNTIPNRRQGNGHSLELLGRVIRHGRVLAGYNHRELAQRARMGEGYLQAIEIGALVKEQGTRKYSQPSAGVLRSVASALDIDPQLLLQLAGHTA